MECKQFSFKTQWVVFSQSTYSANPVIWSQVQSSPIGYDLAGRTVYECLSPEPRRASLNTYLNGGIARIRRWNIRFQRLD